MSNVYEIDTGYYVHYANDPQDTVPFVVAQHLSEMALKVCPTQDILKGFTIHFWNVKKYPEHDSISITKDTINIPSSLGDKNSWIPIMYKVLAKFFFDKFLKKKNKLTKHYFSFRGITGYENRLKTFTSDFVLLFGNSKYWTEYTTDESPYFYNTLKQTIMLLPVYYAFKRDLKGGAIVYKKLVFRPKSDFLGLLLIVLSADLDVLLYKLTISGILYYDHYRDNWVSL